MFVNLKKIKAMFTLYRIVFALTRKGFLFTHKNGDFGAISVTEQSCAAPISQRGGRVGEYSWEFLVGGVPPGLTATQLTFGYRFGYR